MASHLTAGTLRVTVTESMSTQIADAQGTGRDPDTTNYFEIASVATFSRTIHEIPTTETGLLAFAATIATAPVATQATTYVAGHFDEDDVRYIRITNKDNTNFVTLRFRGTDNAVFYIKLESGQSFLYICDNEAGTVGTMDADSAVAAFALQNLEDITADADTAACDVEVFVASV